MNPHVTPPHVLHVFPSFGIGGLPLRTIRVMGHLGSACRHTVVALDGNVSAAERIGDAVAAEIVPLAVDKGRPLATLAVFRRFLASCRPDLLATYNWGAIEWAAVNRLCPVCRHIHFEAGFGAEEATSQFRRRVFGRRWALGGCDCIVVPSHTLERIAVETWRLPKGRIAYIPDGIDVARFAPAPVRRNPPPGELVIGTIAPLRREKNIGRLIEVFARLAGEPGFRLVIAGDGNERAGLERLTAERGLEDRVSFLGQVARPEALLPSFDVFALSSDTEQIPNAVLEAMATALPICAVDVGDVATMVAPENRPFIVPRDDAAAFAAALRLLAGDGGLRQRLGAANRERAVQHYRQELMFEQYEKIILGGARDLLRAA